MSHTNCCVVGCKNNGINSGCKFYRFPSARHKLQQREKWISAVRKINSDGLLWIPKRWSYICSDHFIGGVKRDEINAPNYSPTIFPPIYKVDEKKQQAAIKRHSRFMMRRQKKNETPHSQSLNEQDTSENNNAIACNVNNEFINEYHTNVNYEPEQNIIPKIVVDAECQAEIFCKDMQFQITLICNRLVFSDKSYCDVEVQTVIITDSNPTIYISQKKLKNKGCGTAPKSFEDKYTEAKIEQEKSISFFAGFTTIQKEQQLLDLAGITFENFYFLLKRLNKSGNNSRISQENKLLIFLMKMKLGLTFSALSVLFCVHRTSISKIFYTTLHHLSCATSDLVFWPCKNVVKRTIPDYFKPDYANTRVIIDCTEFRIEVPISVENRVYCYSHYKRGFTAKLLVGITPSGFISFKSKVAGGRKSDTQLTVESGLIDLLEEGDVVLADKGFPEIKQILDNQGKSATVVMPPFFEKKGEFTEQETNETYNIAKVRIHVERIMQRLRTYHILNKIPEHLFNNIDDIVHVCCVLVNLQPPIISAINDNKENS
ncbi:uncharacterized protein [Prorops nasuta]|uniref:uncharacterized protein n=1 Tax=Prorops nasuta TaxID=863751 RepID=UPI0034CEF490